MNQIHLLLSIYNTHVLLRHESDTCINCLYIMYMFCFDMNQIHVSLSIHNTHVLLRHESDTCITVYT